MNILRNFAFAAVSLFAISCYAQQQGYEVLDPPQRTDSGDKVEVLEFFWYGCGHCYRFEPFIGPWHDEAGDNVEFVRMAPPLNPSWKPYSQAYYAAEIMGVLDQFHDEFFSAIHRDKKSLGKPGNIVKFAGSLGIDEDEFRKMMKSFQVDAKIRQATQKARDYKITGVPTVIVNGKYKTSGGIAGSYPALIEALDSLVEKETAG